MSDLSESFEQQLATCLSHLYDYRFLHTHPLIAQLVPDETGANRVHRFREQIAAAIESMRPSPNVPFHAKAARAYNVLSLRYLDQQETETVMQQLALSRRQYFREHAKALETLTAMLWESLHGASPAEPVAPLPQTICVESELASLSQHGENSSVGLAELLTGVVKAAEPLAAQRQVKLTLAEVPSMITFEANRTILRQALLSLLSFLITHAGEHSNLSIDCDSVSDHLEIRIRLAGTTASLPLLEGQDSLFAMIRSLGAALAGPEQGMFVLSMPFEQPTVLVIDDNPDVIDLFRRYLVNQPYRVLAAHNGDQAIRSALAALPDVIILDLMLPKQDGYELLQKLKNHPRTQHIPILICSVLESVDLALALGADGYLKKPPGQSDLLRFLKQWLD